ncbi:MAG: hypothetical protein Q9218_004626, partial [Villophora microphyllina]
MPSLTQSLLSLTFVATIVATASGRLEIRAGCSSNYKKCNPKGSTSANPPALGSDLSPLYTDLVSSVQGVKQSKRDQSGARDQLAALLEARDSSSNLCSELNRSTRRRRNAMLASARVEPAILLCKPLSHIRQPHPINNHQDNYTTNYFLPGGATGQIVSGAYTSTEGTANLLDGDFTKSDGTKGNVYGAEDSPSKPNTATLAIPSQYTASGSISAIPATALGQVATITTTIPGTTVEPTTVAAQTLTPSVSGTSTIGSPTVKAASTVPGTTVAAKTSVYTTTLAKPGATAKGVAAANTPNMSGAAGFGFLL